MKPIAIVLIILCIGVIFCTGYLYMSANIQITATGCVATDATYLSASYEALKESLKQQTFSGTVFNAELPENPEDALFLTYTVELKNATFLPADTLELQITPLAGDMLQMAPLTDVVLQGLMQWDWNPVQINLPAQSSARVSATLLTGKDSHSIRDMKITWYQWGLPFSATVRYSH